MSSIDATWEDMDKMRVDFPNYNLEDKVVVNGEGIDVNRPIRKEETTDMSTKDPRSLLTRDQREDSVAESEKLNWQDQGHVDYNGQPHKEIKRPIRYLD